LAKRIIDKIKFCPCDQIEINEETGVYKFKNIQVSVRNGMAEVTKPFRYEFEQNLQDKIKTAIEAKVIESLEEKVENDEGKTQTSE